MPRSSSMAQEAPADGLPAGLRRASVALVALGEERAASVLAALGESEASELARGVMALGPVSADEIAFALASLGAQLDTIHASTAPGEKYARAMLSRAFGAPSAGKMIEDLTRPSRFEWLAQADPDVASRVLATEPSSAIALALAHLEPRAASRLLSRLPEKRRLEVAVLVANLDAVDEDTVETVDIALRERVGVTLRAQVHRVAGASVLAGMLSAAPRRAEESLVAGLQESDPELARRVRAAMFRFDDLTLLQSRDLQKVLSQVETGDLSVALASAQEDTVAAVMRNLSERAQENLTDEMSYLQHVRPADARAAQERVMEVVRTLEADREIVIPRAGDDEEEFEE